MTQAHESSMWSTVAQMLESSLEHYQAAEGEAAEPASRDSGTSPGGADDATLARFNQAAVRVLEKAVAKFVQLTGAK